jgi:hypothetical protein
MEAKDKQSCIKLLLKYPDALTKPGSAYEWLKDAIAIDLTPTEIVSLLFEESEQSPWICYELTSPDETEATDYRSDYIQYALPRPSDDPVTKISEIEIKRKVSELCGLGGIIPTPYDRVLWLQNADIDSFGETKISYGPALQSGRVYQWVHEVLDTCSDALNRLVKLIRWLQSHEVTSDHVVIFRAHSIDQRIEAIQFPVGLITELRRCVTEITMYSAAE